MDNYEGILISRSTDTKFTWQANRNGCVGFGMTHEESVKELMDVELMLEIEHANIVGDHEPVGAWIQ